MITREYVVNLIKDNYKEITGDICSLSCLQIERELRHEITLIEEKFYTMKSSQLTILLDNSVEKLKDAWYYNM